MGRRWIWMLLLVMLPVSLMAEERKTGTSAAPFLTIGIGARPQAMGGAFVAMSDDIHSLFWNPAGLARMNSSEVMLVHSTWLADMSFDYIGLAFNMGQAGTLGLSATMLSVGEMEITTEQYQDGTGLMFDSYDMAAAVSYGYKFYDRFSIGFTGKYIRQVIWNESASGFALDMGTLFITPFKDIRLGMNITNFGTDMSMEGRDLLVFYDPDATKEGNNESVPAQIKTEAWPLPLTMRLGLAGEVIQTPNHRLTLSGDWVVPNDNTEFVNVGTEYAFNEYAFLRAGYKGIRPYTSKETNNFSFGDGDNGAGFTFGGGAKLALQGNIGINIDYAFESFFRLGNVHKFSIALKF